MERVLSFNDWVIEAALYVAKNVPEQRVGQAYFNSLAFHNESLANFLIGTPADPFYDDQKLHKFFNVAEGLW